MNITWRQIFYSLQRCPNVPQQKKRGIAGSFYGTVTLSGAATELYSLNLDNFLDLVVLIRYNAQLKGRENQAGTPRLCLTLMEEDEPLA